MTHDATGVEHADLTPQPAHTAAAEKLLGARIIHKQRGAIGRCGPLHQLQQRVKLAIEIF